MAGRSRLTVFYALIAAVALVGVGFILTQRGGGSAQGFELTPIDLGGFEGHVLGSPDAPVEIIEYADFQCPACSRYAILTEPDIVRRLVIPGTARIVFRDFPLSIHSNAMPAHMAAACAGEQGQFWEMHDSLYFNQNDWAVNRRPERVLRGYADAIGLDMGQYRECVSSARYLGRLQASAQEAAALGVGSTPSFIIDGRMYTGFMSYDQVKAIVDQVLAEGSD